MPNGGWDNAWVDVLLYIQHFGERQRETAGQTADRQPGLSRGMSHRRLTDQHICNSRPPEINSIFSSRIKVWEYTYWFQVATPSSDVTPYQTVISILSLLTIIKTITIHHDQTFSFFPQEHSFLFVSPVVKKISRLTELRGKATSFFLSVRSTAILKDRRLN